MSDQSHLDDRYFVDSVVYNCPFCNRRSVEYSIYDQVQFDWSRTKECRALFIQCHSCRKQSMHLTHAAVKTFQITAGRMGTRYRFSLPETLDQGEVLDECMFYSVPTSFFVLDDRVPRVLRELLTEAEGSLKSNFLTGGSACARKIVYELAAHEKASGDNYEERIKSLKGIHPEVDEALFDTLLTIQQITSTKVHEGSFDGWEAKHLRIILAALREVLHEIYVVPALRRDRRDSVLGLKQKLLGPSESAGTDECEGEGSAHEQGNENARPDRSQGGPTTEGS